jgi:hypothetical protein
MKTCKTCKWWDRPKPTTFNGEARAARPYNTIYSKTNVCKRIPMEDDAWDWKEIERSDEKRELVLREEWENTTAFACDGSSYIAYLSTQAEFGCTMHEEEDEK